MYGADNNIVFISIWPEIIISTGGSAPGGKEAA
jgi:hypothetical protein